MTALESAIATLGSTPGACDESKALIAAALATQSGEKTLEEATASLFGWDQPMQPPAKAKRGTPKGNASPIGSGPASETCGSCANCYRVEFSKVYWKCRLVKATCGPGTDIRRKWAACSQWHKKEEKA